MHAVIPVCVCVLMHWQRLTVIYKMRLQLHHKYTHSPSSDVSQEIYCDSDDEGDKDSVVVTWMHYEKMGTGR